LPDAPVTVSVTVPVAAVLLALNVSVLVPFVLLGLNAPVTPLGKPDTDKLTLPLNPLCALSVMVLAPVVPCKIVNVFGDAERVKFPCGFTLRETVAVLVKLPEVPETVTVAEPIVAVPLADSVNRLLLVAGFVLKVAVTPLGRPEAVKATLPLNPFCGLIVIVVEPAVPCTKVKLPGDADSVKLGSVEDPGQLFTRLATLTVPMPVAKSHPTLVP
jgi:hypothetical protein